MYVGFNLEELLAIYSGNFAIAGQRHAHTHICV